MFSPMNTTGSHNIAIRLATGADAASLAQLAILDSAPALRGLVLVATIDGSVIAATSLVDGRAIADPFRPAADARALLALRASQLPRESQSRRRHLPGFLPRRRGLGSRSAAAAA